jgi:hypothetical protein
MFISYYSLSRHSSLQMLTTENTKNKEIKALTLKDPENLAANQLWSFFLATGVFSFANWGNCLERRNNTSN